MRIKICGLTSADAASAVLDAGADLVGFVFVEGTPRALDSTRAEWIRRLSGRGTVGVFRNASLETVIETRQRLRLDWVQLHGSEPDEWLDQLGKNVLRWVAVDNGGPNWDRVQNLAQCVMPLIDPGAGDGQVCEWTSLAQKRPPAVSFGLAGGLCPENVAEAVRRLRPALVDVSSGVESAPGIKDLDRVREFVSQARSAEAAMAAPQSSRRD
ncbi:MAG: phosphoribosylanthranilate isomerase [bacterium]|nr:phosphoribosylanthranilate isomerase [bacterium]